VDWSLLAVAVGIVLGAAVISGITGFGFGLVSVPPLLMLYDPAAVLTITKVLTLTTSWIVIVHSWRSIKPRMIATILPWSILGTLAGLQLLRVASEDMIKLIASAVVISFALLLIRGLPEREWNHPLLSPLAGIASGAMSTSTGLSGPPIVLYFTLRNVDVMPFRVTIATYFVLLDLFGMPALIQQDFVTRDDLLVAVALVPMALLGRIIGIRLSHRFSRAQFYRFTLGILVVTGALGIISSINDYL
jgi:uncharacterized membrane protein YfcA